MNYENMSVKSLKENQTRIKDLISSSENDENEALNFELQTVNAYIALAEIEAKTNTLESTIIAKDATIDTLNSKIQTLEQNESENNSEQLTNDLNTANDKIKTLEASIVTKDQKINDQTSEISTLTTELEGFKKMNSAYEDVINAAYGEGSTERFVANSTGGIDQPELVLPNKGNQPMTQMEKDNLSRQIVEEITATKKA